MRKYILLALLIGSTSVFAQVQDTIAKGELSLYGGFALNNMTVPGFKVGAEYVLDERVQHIQRIRSLAAIHEQYVLDVNFGALYQKHYYYGMYANCGLNYKRVMKNGNNFYTGAKPIGVFVSKYTRRTFEVDENSNVVEILDPGRTYFAPAIDIGFDLIISDVSTCFIQANSIFLMSYNSYVMPLIFVDFGFRFKILD